MKLSTLDEIIDALGGVSATADILEVVPHSISMMKRRGVPHAHHLKLFLAAEARGHVIDTEIAFGYSSKTLRIKDLNEELTG